jgi:glycosyltransferase involved in cell wall biosynthesis
VSEQLPFVSVVVPARNCERTISACTNSLLSVDYPPSRRELLVVDNASTDRTPELIHETSVRYLYESRRGASAARNRGIASSKGEIVAFVDADCVVSKAWLSQMVAGFEQSGVMGVAGEIVAFPPRTPAERYQAMRNGRWQESALRSSLPFPLTGNVAFRRQTFDRIGLFDPALAQAEDKDFGWRFFAANLELAYRPTAVVMHRHRSSAWGLLKQHAGWGYGNALLHRKHGLPWSVRQELGKQRELAGAMGELCRALLRHRADGGDSMDVYYPCFELLRRAGLRAGALGGLATTRLRTGAAPRGAG